MISSPRALGRLSLILIAAFLLPGALTARPTATPAALPPTGLATVFEPGLILQDRNGDDQVDFADVRIVLPDNPAPGDVAAASAVAARLGLETSGLTLPLVFHASNAPADAGTTTTILIGADNPRLAPEVRARITALPEGQGLVTIDTGSGTTVTIAGKDADGTQAAGEAFASRSPYLWNVIGRAEGDTFDRLVADVEGVVNERATTVGSVAFDEFLYEKDRREMLRATLTVAVPSGRAARARDRIVAIADGHRQGRATDTLNYASVTEMVYRVTDGADAFEVVVPRVGLPSRYTNPPRQEPTRFQGQRETGAGARGGGGAAGGGGEGAAGRAGGRGRPFDLADLFTPGTGLLADDDGDGVPDDTDSMVVLPATTPTPGDYPSVGTAHLAARLGLESTGLSLPFVGFDNELRRPEGETRPLVLVGRHNRLVQELTAIGKVREPGPAPGVGRVELVPDANRGTSAVIITGGNTAGEESAADYLARRAPHVWTTGLGLPTLEQAKATVRKILGGRTTAAQAALAVRELDDVLLTLEDKSLESIAINSYFEEVAPGFDAWLRDDLGRRLGGTDAAAAPTVTVTSHARMGPVTVFEQTPDLPWEVDTFWTAFKENVVPKITPGAEVSLELRVSEAPELRRDLVTQIRTAITEAGGQPGDVRVLSAYKQGLSWLTDHVAPAIRDRAPATIEIGWKPFPVAAKTEERFQNEPARWLNELYPADDVLAAQLKLPLSAISFRMLEATAEDTYSVTVRNARGVVLLEDTFSPKSYERPYFEAFKDYATITATTGWLRASVGDTVLTDERIKTDSDEIWDHYQTVTLKAVHEHVRQSTGNRPTRDKAPYFHTLRVELEASEPDYLIGVDQEHISVLESLHDDIYFDTLDFFSHIADEASGGTGQGRSLAAGNVLPWILPERRGQAPRLKITYSAFASKDPKVVVSYREKDSTEKTPTVVTRTLAPANVPEPYLYLAETRTGAASLDRLGFLLTLPTPEPLTRLAVLLDNLTRLQSAGLFTDAFPLGDVRAASIRLEAPGALSTRTFRASAPVRVHPAAAPPGPTPLVTWDHVISPDESEYIAHALGTLPHVTTYVAGHSYQGRPVSVMELRMPMEAELVSQAKLNTWKPVLSIVGRQHANEVSSTSHILRLAELLATDPQYQGYLKTMNVVMQPVVNPDGAALAYELQKLTPLHCLHAGRYSALGPDVSAGLASDENTLVTEALVLRDVNRRWVADVSLNPHGYPSHEWVHQFANYNPRAFRSYWIPRGWWTNVRAIEDPRLKAYADVADAMVQYISNEVSRDAESRTTNLRIYDRYQRWTTRWQPHLYDLEIINNTAIYNRRTGTGVSVASPQAMVRPTAFSGMTEAMDETAQGPWLDLVTRMGFDFLMASVKFIDEAEPATYRIEGESGGAVRLAVLRPRPLRPGGR